MYGIPKDLDLTEVIGESTTQIRVGQFDIQFDMGKMHFAVYSPIILMKNGSITARWDEGVWPESGFIEILNVKATKYSIPDQKTIILTFENGIEMYLIDSSDEYESMLISIEGNSNMWII